MRIDLYTKGVLTVIAVLLAVIAFRPYVSPDAVVQAQGRLPGCSSQARTTPLFLTPALVSYGLIPMAS